MQGLDSQLDKLAHQRRTLPENAALDRLEARVAELADSLVAVQTEESDTAREQAKAESDVEQVRARSQRDQQRLDAGNVGSAKELESLQHEIGSLRRRQSDLEEVVLEIMERREEAQQRLTALTTEREATLAERDEVGKRREAALSDLDREESETTAGRATLAAEIPQDLLALYERLREQRGGVGAAALRQRRCDGCRLEINTVDLGRIKQAPPDEVLRCEDCRRILVRTSESGL